jgi:RNA polymerase sigma-70 factor (ECF subfamily)
MESGSEELVAAVSSGDAGAVEALLERYLPDLRAYVARHAGDLVRAKESSADLAQSVCREVLESLRSGRLRYQGEAQFRQWLYRAALMKMMNRHRFWTAERRDARLEGAGGAGAGASESGASSGIDARLRDSATPSRALELQEELELFQRAFAALPEHYREVIALHHIERLSHAEVAERLKISEPNSRMLLARALARLARHTSSP